MIEKSIVTCRLDDDTIVTFSSHASDRDHLMGTSDSNVSHQGLQVAVGVLPVGEDRYFFNGPIRVFDRGVTLSVDIELFKLQRRKTLRVSVPVHSGLSLSLTKVNGLSQLRPAGILDLSAGGMKIYLQDETQGALDISAKLEATLGLPSDKKLSFAAQVMHLQMATVFDRKGLHYGLLFTDPTPAFTNRMQALTFQMQKLLLHD